MNVFREKTEMSIYVSNKEIEKVIKGCARNNSEITLKSHIFSSENIYIFSLFFTEKASTVFKCVGAKIFYGWVQKKTFFKKLVFIKRCPYHFESQDEKQIGKNPRRQKRKKI